MSASTAVEKKPVEEIKVLPMDNVKFSPYQDQTGFAVSCHSGETATKCSSDQVLAVIKTHFADKGEVVIVGDSAVEKYITKSLPTTLTLTSLGLLLLIFVAVKSGLCVGSKVYHKLFKKS